MVRILLYSFLSFTFIRVNAVPSKVELCVVLTNIATGVPFGLGIIQTAWKEESLTKFGSAIEDLIGGRPIPQFMNISAKNYMYVRVKS
jgi:hypothetical protein